MQTVEASADLATVLITGMPSMIWSSESGFQETVRGAMALSGDGSTIMGARSFFGELPYDDSFVWTPEGGYTYLGTIDGFVSNHALDISYDGSIVVGTLFDDIMNRQEHAAYIWTVQSGIRLIQDILENDYGLDLAGWRLTSATGISDDGLTIVGNGFNPLGFEEGWIATIPEPSTLLLTALGALMLRNRCSSRYRKQ
ncbi:MAG TPA: PEP-CTERM sorting domain-containing protein [Anaerohalosphaeraceae bacterium]|jgi:uncharacterized membrane protein|nr:PEP-CTERM sorting domain-containing protein [Anaerohalosphaeraceae bacterium]HRT49858.1 PEP-CTERM sorting domain-containing protein [Anaerohalosphaeraceae bacterium]HRT86750.1 PEP-CTERM sorting domain-containing protein [Anaerohalosphaeraceae bacterium]